MSWTYFPVSNVSPSEKDPVVFLNAAITVYQEQRFGVALEFAKEASRVAENLHNEEIAVVGHVYEVRSYLALNKNSKAHELTKQYDSPLFRQYMEMKDLPLYGTKEMAAVPVSEALEKWLDDKDFLSLEDTIWGDTPLHIAVAQGDIEIIKELAQCGADMFAKNKAGDTPLMLALQNKSNDILQTLLKYVTDSNRDNLNETNGDGCTLLHIAAAQDNSAVCEKIAALGADLFVQNKDGDTPLMLALKSNLPELSMPYSNTSMPRKATA